MEETPIPSPQLDLSPYINRWIALVRGRVVGVGLTSEQAEHAAKRARPKDKAQVVFVNGEGNILVRQAATESSLSTPGDDQLH